MKGILHREAGSGRNTWLIKPKNDNSSSICVDYEDSQTLTDQDLGKVVEYEVIDKGHEFFKKSHYQEWLMAKIKK
jgi:hypothetical protein